MPPINRSSGIKVLCSLLGYDETQDKDSPQHSTRLPTLVRQFRRINKAYDIPTCAIEFCERAEKDMSFFTSSREAKKHGWPVLPGDKVQTIEIITRLTYIKEPQSRETERTTRNRNNLLDLLNNGKPPELEDYPGKLSINVDKANDTLVRIKREEIDWAEDAGLGERDDEIEENIQCKTNKLIREEWNSGD